MAYFKSSEQHTTSKVIAALSIFAVALLFYAVQVFVAAWAYREVAPNFGWPELGFWQFWWLFLLIKMLMPSAPRGKSRE